MIKRSLVTVLFCLCFPLSCFAASTAWFAPYVDVSGWPKPDINALANKNGVKHYTLAFLVDKTGSACDASWGTYYDVDYLKDDVAKLRSNGGDVMISLGGQANTPLAAACTTASTLAKNYENIINVYQLKKIDFDIEGKWISDSASLQRRIAALKIVQHKHPKLQLWLTLPVLPSGLTDGVQVVDQMVAAGINIGGVNIMAMDFGNSAAPNPDGKMGAYAIQAATSLQQQLKTIYSKHNISKTDAALWQMIGITPMIGMNDVTTEKFTIKDAQQVTDFAKQHKLPFLGMWSMNRDHQCSPPTIPYVSLKCSSVPQADFGFSMVFNTLAS